MKTQTSAGFRDPASAPRVETVEVGEDRDGQRLDNFLTGRLKGVPKSHVYRLLRTGQVRVNGKRAKPDYRVATGDSVRIPPVRMGEPAEHGAPAEGDTARVEAAILAEDRDFIVIDKPSGVASHGGSGVSFGAIELMRAARPNDTLELVHRLDRDTSGVLVLAKRRAALTALQAEIRGGRVEKRYLALLAGALPQARLSVDAPLLKSVLQGGERMVRVDDAGKPSRSRFAEVERYKGNATLAEIAIETGRTHQIRVHSAHIEHPVAGDDKYGDKAFNAAMRRAGLKRLFLHAARFEFSIGERSYAFSAPLPAELKAVLDALSGGAVADAGDSRSFGDGGAEVGALRPPRTGERDGAVGRRQSGGQKREARAVSGDRSERAERSLRGDRLERAPRAKPAGASDRANRSQRAERSAGMDRSTRSERSARPDRATRADASARPGRSARNDRPGRVRAKKSATAKRGAGARSGARRGGAGGTSAPRSPRGGGGSASATRRAQKRRR